MSYSFSRFCNIFSPLTDKAMKLNQSCKTGIVQMLTRYFRKRLRGSALAGAVNPPVRSPLPNTLGHWLRSHSVLSRLSTSIPRLNKNNIITSRLDSATHLELREMRPVMLSVTEYQQYRATGPGFSLIYARSHGRTVPN
ncbi:hypothetical protein SAMN05421882_10468 [Nitrosomonas communis]|uniref:Uncharacterized protein n=1 Tax=Nitrosomonas communis TaxID=44574 RepID=A0A1H2Y2V5_9PROT|nr:hypothetical protein SAMN05421882_10468 [Nitrosomonas communis]